MRVGVPVQWVWRPRLAVGGDLAWYCCGSHRVQSHGGPPPWRPQPGGHHQSQLSDVLCGRPPGGYPCCAIQHSRPPKGTNDERHLWPTCGRPYATHNPTLLKNVRGHITLGFDLSSLTLPEWGGLHDGELCEHPTPALLTRELRVFILAHPSGQRHGRWQDSGVVGSLDVQSGRPWSEPSGLGSAVSRGGSANPAHPRAMPIDRLYLREDNQSHPGGRIRLPGVTGKRIGQQSNTPHHRTTCTCSSCHYSPRTTPEPLLCGMDDGPGAWLGTGHGLTPPKS